MGLHIFEIERNAEGIKLAYMPPCDSDGNAEGGYRIAGPKAWGGSTSLAKIAVSEKDLVEYIKAYAPDIIKRLNA